MIKPLPLIETHRVNVVGRPVPWSVPDIGTGRSKAGKKFRFAAKNDALERWQGLVSRAARLSYGPYEPHVGPVHLAMHFMLHHDDEEMWGQVIAPRMEWIENQARHKKQGGLPDRTNLIKGVEDALEGIFFVNDTQVRSGVDVCVWSGLPGVVIDVGFIDAYSKVEML